MRIFSAILFGKTICGWCVIFIFVYYGYRDKTKIEKNTMTKVLDWNVVAVVSDRLVNAHLFSYPVWENHLWLVSYFIFSVQRRVVARGARVYA